MELTYIDSSILIDATSNPDARGDSARAAFMRAGDAQLQTSSLVELECMVHPLRSGDSQRISRMRLALSRFKRVDVSDRAFELAAHIRAIHGFKTPDALHVATATLNGCSSFWTRDEKLIQAMPGFAVDPTATS